MVKLILTADDKAVTSYLIDADTDRTIEIRKDPAHRQGIRVGEIFVGRIEKIVPSLHAAFVRIGSGLPDCYLALEDASDPLFVKKSSHDALRPGDEIVVQVKREGIKSKAPALTTALTLKGTYLLLGAGAGVSKKLDPAARARLKEKAAALQEKVSGELRRQTEGLSCLPEAYRQAGLLVRTAAGSADWSEVEKEADALLRDYVSILTGAPHRTVFTCLRHEEPQFLSRIRSLLPGETERIVTDQADLYEEICSFAARQLPALSGKVFFYEDPLLPMHALYSLERRMQEALGRIVHLKSGAYLVIEPTEAMTVIDVNSGKSSAGKARGVKTEETRRVNLEAAAEICAQLRLRNMSGIIMTDFINTDRETQEELCGFMRGLMKQDSVQCGVIDVTALGLMEITRKKVEKPLWES